MKKTAILTALLILAVCSLAAADRKDCTEETPGACFETHQDWSCNWDEPVDLDQNGVVDFLCVFTDGANDFTMENPGEKFFFHRSEHNGLFLYCPFPLWEFDESRSDECYWGTGDLSVSIWYDPSLGVWECPGKGSWKGFGTRSDGAEIAAESRFQTLKKRGECVLHKFWIKTIP